MVFSVSSDAIRGVEGCEPIATCGDRKIRILLHLERQIRIKLMEKI